MRKMFPHQIGKWTTEQGQRLNSRYERQLTLYPRSQFEPSGVPSIFVRPLGGSRIQVSCKVNFMVISCFRQSSRHDSKVITFGWLVSDFDDFKSNMFMLCMRLMHNKYISPPSQTQ